VKEKAFKTIIVAKEKLGFGTLEKHAKEPNFGAMTTFYLDKHTCTQRQTQMKTTNKEGEKERPQINKREKLRERIATAIFVTFFFHILGETDGLVDVASQGSLILGY